MSFQLLSCTRNASPRSIVTTQCIRMTISVGVALGSGDAHKLRLVHHTYFGVDGCTNYKIVKTRGPSRSFNRTQNMSRAKRARDPFKRRFIRAVTDEIKKTKTERNIKRQKHKKQTWHDTRLACARWPVFRRSTRWHITPKGAAFVRV